MHIVTVIIAAGAENFGENAADWLTNQLVWVALLALIVVLALTLAKRNFIGAIISVIGGSIVIYFIANPTIIKTLGETIMNKIIGG